MINEFNGDVLAVDSAIIVHGCNCQGVMGSGVAAEVRARYPDAYKAYKYQESSIGLKLGEISYAKVGDDKYIVNALTQHLFGSGNAPYANNRLTSYDAVAECFYKVLALCYGLSCARVVFPLIGAVRGGGDWEVIAKIIDKTIPDSIAKELYIFNPGNGN